MLGVGLVLVELLHMWGRAYFLWTQTSKLTLLSPKIAVAEQRSGRFEEVIATIYFIITFKMARSFSTETDMKPTQ